MQHLAPTAIGLSTGPGSLHLRPSPSRSAPSGQPPPSSVSPFSLPYGLHCYLLCLPATSCLTQSGLPSCCVQHLVVHLTVHHRNGHLCSTHDTIRATHGMNGGPSQETHLYASALIACSEACAACSPLQSEQSSLWASVWGRPHNLDGRYCPIILRRPSVHCDRWAALPQLSYAYCSFAVPYDTPLCHTHAPALSSKVLVLCASVSQNRTVIGLVGRVR